MHGQPPEIIRAKVTVTAKPEAAAGGGADRKVGEGKLEKKRTAMFPHAEVLQYSQIGEKTTTRAKEGTNSSKVLLEAKLDPAALLNRSVGVDAGPASVDDDIGQV